jgi:NADPH-dependent curcumin reductase CurA
VLGRNLNPEFIDSLTSWVFQESGVVRVISTEHYRLRDAVGDVVGNGTVGKVKESRDRFKGYTVGEEVVSVSSIQVLVCVTEHVGDPDRV